MENPYRLSGPLGSIRHTTPPGFLSWAGVLLLLGGAALFSLDCIVEALVFRASSFDEEWLGWPTSMALLVVLGRLLLDRILWRKARLKARKEKAPEPAPDMRGMDELSPGELRGDLLTMLLFLALVLEIVIDELGDGFVPLIKGAARAMAYDGSLFAAVAAVVPLSLLGGWLVWRELRGRLVH